MPLKLTLMHLLYGMLFTALPYTIARLWLKRIRRQRRNLESAERSIRIQALADASCAARARGEQFVPPPGWDA